MDFFARPEAFHAPADVRMQMLVIPGRHISTREPLVWLCAFLSDEVGVIVL